MKAKAYIPKEKYVIEVPKFHDRIEAMEYAIAHYKRVRWFRLHKDIPVHQDVIYGCGLIWDYKNMKLKKLNAEQSAEAEKAERILFQFLRSIEALQQSQDK
jgi:hypothetical protein